MESAKRGVDEIYLAALEKPSAQARSVFLDRACAGDDELRRRVERLLRAQPHIGNFLEAPAPEFAATIIPSLAEPTGTVIGPYKILEQIGEGGFGIVYMADQQSPVRRRVALKIIKPGMDTKEVLARFRAELQALALMDHPNIARALDAGATDAGRPYFVMELVRGVPITDYCDQNKLAVHERLDLFVQVCHAVQHAHQKGIIHRDIKPSNVLVTLQDGRPVPKVIDFGVAKAIDRQLTEETLFTHFAEMIGTPMYMSPEQAEMTSLDIDTRSDIYSLGVLLYELLTGSTPFDKTRLTQAAFDEIRRIIREEEPPRPSMRISRLGALSAIVAAHRHADPARLSQIVRGDLDWIVMKALEKDRTRRYETANSLALDVQRYLADEPVQACPPSRRYRLRKFVRRHKGPVLAASSALLALVAGIIGTTWGMIRATDAEVEAVHSARQTNIALDIAQKSERAKSEQLWQALVAQARAHRLSRRPGQRFESLATLQRATQLARALELPGENFQALRNAAIATLAVPDLYLEGPWKTWPPDALALDFDEAHSIYARTDRTGNCSIRRVADDAEIHRLPGLGWPAAPFLSRDGKFIAINHMNGDLIFAKGVQVWQLDESKPRQLLSEPLAGSVVFRESQQFALAYKDGSISLFELPTARQLSRLAPDTLTHGFNIALHPSEPLVAASSYLQKTLQLRDVRTGKTLASLEQSDRPMCLAWHPNGRILAVGYNSSQIRLFDRTTWQAYRTLQIDLVPTSIDFDRAGDWLAACGWGSLVGLFDLYTGERLMGTQPNVAACRFSRDGLRMAGGVQDGRLGTWRVAGGKEFRRVICSEALPDKEVFVRATVHPDGRLLACALSNGIGIWDLSTGSELGFIRSDWKNNYALFERSGALLTLTFTGLSRWPVGKDLDATRGLSIGPPEPLPLPNGSDLAQSRDGRIIATCDRNVSTQIPYAGGWILHTDRPKEPIRVDAGADIADIAVSPDGRWVVTSTHVVGLAKIWDARDGRLVKQLANWGANSPRFSPDSHWLATNLRGGCLVDVNTWEPRQRLGPRCGFAPDSRLAAVPTANGLRLTDAASGREVAMLEDPNLDSIVQVVFTPDGTKLIALSFMKGLHVWDLRLIRRQLKDLGLDWDWPEFPPTVAASRQDDVPTKLKIRLGDKWVSEAPDKSQAKPKP